MPKKKTTQRPPPTRYTEVDKLTLASLRRRPSQQRGSQRVRDVLDAFERLLRQKRCEQITMDDLSRTAGIQIGSLYHFFPDITSVILTVLERALADEAAAFEARPKDESLDFVDYLETLERRMTLVWRRHGSLMSVFFAYQRHPLIWKITRQQRDRTAALVGAKLRQLSPGLSAARANDLGQTIGVVMALLIDNLEFLPDAEGRRMRNETRLLLGRHVAAEGVPVVAPTNVSVNVGRKTLVRRISRVTRS
jgi:AcrR family transcriptional regulator